LNCFISVGQVSHNIQGSHGRINSICKDCWDYILDRATIPAPDQKCFTLRDVSSDNFDAFIEAVKEYNNVQVTSQVTDNNQSIRNHYHLKGKYDAKLSVIYYENGTLLVQGSITLFYVEFVTEILESISSVSSAVIEEVFSITSAGAYVIEKDLDRHFSKLDHIVDSISENFINTSISLANSAVQVDDYGCYTFGVLKALDAILRKRLLEDAPEFVDYGTYFEKDRTDNYHFVSGVATYNSNTRLKGALERGYTFFSKNRHSTFHVDRFNVETSRILNYDDAVNIIKECLVIINNICDNW
jgi:hypothetical protein